LELRVAATVKKTNEMATSAHSQRRSPMLRQPVSSLLSTGSWGNCRSSSWQVAASASLLSSTSFCVLPTLISMLSAVSSSCSTPRRGMRSSTVR
jgi:hypothetical protein